MTVAVGLDVSLDMKVNKTDANDAEGLAHLVRAGWYREVRVKRALMPFIRTVARLPLERQDSI